MDNSKIASSTCERGGDRRDGWRHRPVSTEQKRARLEYTDEQSDTREADYQPRNTKYKSWLIK